MKIATTIPQLTARQVSRSAGATIAGYQYQFELSVVKVLNLNEGEIVRVEGIEDIDFWSDEPSIIQVKYYEGQKWSLPVVRKAVHELLQSFVSGLKVKYVLYTHFGSGDTPPERFSLQDLKDCLTYRPRNEPIELLYDGIDDEVLIDFTNHFTICHGVSLEDQRKITTAAIAKALDCSEDEAESLHRMRAVQFLHEVATRKEEKDREVSRQEIINLLGSRDVFYSRWHKETVGRERFISATSKKLKVTGFNASDTYRGVYLNVTSENLNAVCRLASEIANDMNGTIKRRSTSAKPWTLILRGEDEVISSVKKSLIEDRNVFNDGFESFIFSPDIFNEPVITKGTGRVDRLAKASYVIRVISERSMKTLVGSRPHLSQVVSLIESDGWLSETSHLPPTRVHEVSIDDLTEILRRVTS